MTTQSGNPRYENDKSAYGEVASWVGCSSRQKTGGRGVEGASRCLST